MAKPVRVFNGKGHGQKRITQFTHWFSLQSTSHALHLPSSLFPTSIVITPQRTTLRWRVGSCHEATGDALTGRIWDTAGDLEWSGLKPRLPFLYVGFCFMDS